MKAKVRPGPACCAVLGCVVLNCAVLYRTVLYCAVMCARLPLFFFSIGDRHRWGGAGTLWEVICTWGFAVDRQQQSREGRSSPGILDLE